MGAESSTIEFYHPCERCKKRGTRCIPNGAYGACERCQKKRCHCSNMESKAKQPDRRFVSGPYRKLREEKAQNGPWDKPETCGSCKCSTKICRCNCRDGRLPDIQRFDPPSKTSKPQKFQITIEAGVRVIREPMTHTTPSPVPSPKEPRG